MKSVAKNWKDFVGDMASEEEKEEARKREKNNRKSKKSIVKNAKQNEEASETWALGKKLGIVARVSEEEIMRKLKGMERVREAVEDKNQESKQGNHQ